ncbi:MAG: endonuclease/exonuclease/phosphatase family protein [Myxococcota bacterium]|nr:endonuclease/exonuclease/phosphatase family protein [Myxococcota bacterium]
MRLRILTLNVWGLPLGLTRHHDDRMRAIGQSFANSGADVIALQEVWTEGGRRVLAAAGKDAGYGWIWHRPAAFGGSGLMVLSRLPIRAHSFTRFRLAGLPQRPYHGDFYAGKGFVNLQFATDAGPLTLVDTHLHAGYRADEEFDEYRGIRAAQAIEIAAHLRSVPTPVIAVGDFNTSEGDDAYAILLALSGCSDLAVDLDKRQATCLAPHPYRGAGATEERIDLVLARSGPATKLEAVALDRVFDDELVFDGEAGRYSDHAGLRADFALHRRRDGLAPFEPAALNAAPINAAAINAAPINAAALDHAESELQWGIRAAHARRRAEFRGAGVTVAGSLLAGGAAWRMRRRRRSFLSNLGLGFAGLGLFGGLAALLGSHRVVENEVAGFADIEKILTRLRAESAGAGSLPSS